MGILEAQESEYGIYHKDDLKTYKKILIMTNARLTRY